MVGEGRILGGVFVVGPGQEGILLDHKEKEFGDKVDLKDVRDAVLRMKSSNQRQISTIFAGIFDLYTDVPIRNVQEF